MNNAQRSTIEVLEAVIKLLTVSGSDIRVVKDLQKIVLRERKLVGISSVRKPRYLNKGVADEASFKSAQLADLEKVLEREVDRRTLEKILTDRFNYSESSVKRISNKEKLVSSIRMSIKNESAHQTISKLTRS